ncbi:NAD(P)-binding protein [Hortaea werneckii]|nr:NAD(P)-binding protein [Hortaea werneckii]
MSTSDILTGFLPHFFYSQFFITPTYPTQDCSGRTIIVTGSNTGLGKEAVRHFVRLNAEKVIIACRSTAKGEAAKQDVEASTGRKGVVDVWPLDLTDYESVKAFAQRAKGLARLDVALLNAGIIWLMDIIADTPEFTTVAGNESTITVNVVSTFLLALLLLPKLQESGNRFNTIPTLTVVSSEMHFVTSFPERNSPTIFKTLNEPEEARMAERYALSKLLEVLACREIARNHSVDQVKVTLNFVNPGWCISELVRYSVASFGSIAKTVLNLVMRVMCRTTEVGSRTLVHAGLSGLETHGKYMSNCRIEECAPLVQGKEGPEIQRRVWQELSEKLNEIEPGVTKVLDS